MRPEPKPQQLTNRKLVSSMIRSTRMKIRIRTKRRRLRKLRHLGQRRQLAESAISCSIHPVIMDRTAVMQPADRVQLSDSSSKIMQAVLLRQHQASKIQS